MKKSLLIVASLALGTAAFAQTTQTPAEQGSTPSESSQSPGAQTMPSTPDNSGATAPSTGGDMSGGQGMSQGTTPPTGGDMSGGQGMSQGGMASGGAGNMAAAQQTASSTDTSNYPKCSKTVTDKCVSAGGSGMHRTMHHRPMRHKKPA